MTGVSNEYDEIIFDYLEGNLSVNERQAFEMLLSSNEALKAEVSVWKKTCIVESFQATVYLEKQILGSVKRTRWFFSLNLFTAILVLLFIPARVKDAAIASQKFQITGSVHTEERQDITPAPLTEVNLSHDESLKRQVSEHEMTPNTSESVKTDELITEDVMIAPPAPETLPLMIVSRSVRISKPVPVQLPASRVKKFSWKETSLINRKKRRDHQKKIENKFLEGNVPYVVPLDVTNF